MPSFAGHIPTLQHIAEMKQLLLPAALLLGALPALAQKPTAKPAAAKTTKTIAPAPKATFNVVSEQFADLRILR